MEKIDYFYSTKEYAKNRHFFDFYKENRSELFKYLKKTDKDIEFWHWYRMVTDVFVQYYRRSKEYELLVSYSKKTNITYSDVYLFKNIVQNDYSFGIEYCIDVAYKKLEKIKETVFEFLDSRESPYKDIFFPVWELNTKVFEKGYFPYQVAGVSEVSLFVAKEYAISKICNKWTE